MWRGRGNVLSISHTYVEGYLTLVNVDILPMDMDATVAYGGWILSFLQFFTVIQPEPWGWKCCWL
jgi:hypothetical protein